MDDFREIGASIALQPCGLRILEKLGVGEEVEELAYRGESKASMVSFDFPSPLHPSLDLASNLPSLISLFIPEIYRNYQTAEVLAAPPPTRLPLPHHQTARFFRPHLHQVLTSRIPPTRLHLNKRLVRIEETEEEVVLIFGDGETFVCDLVVGCESFRSLSYLRRSSPLPH